MTANDFRKLALSFPEVIESAHMHHPDFRVGGKIFATLGYPDKDWAMVKLTRDKQKEFVQSNPGVFKLVKGAWAGKAPQISICRRRREKSCAKRSPQRGAIPHQNGY